MSADQNNPRVRFALEAYQRGDLARAASLLGALVREHPQDAQLLHALGVVEIAWGKFDSAIDYLERALKSEPQNPHALTALAHAKMNAGAFDDARSRLEELIALYPDLPDAHVNLGVVHMECGNAEAARECYARAIAIKPDFVDAIVKLAWLSEREHKCEEAHTLASKAVSFAPSNAAANIALARVRLRMGRQQQAIDQLEQLIKTSPISEHDVATMRNLIGQAKNKLRRHNEAFVAYDAANAAYHRLYRSKTLSTQSTLSPKFINKLSTFFEREDIAAWTMPKKLEGPAPIFLVGFPRSGTTLLEQILNAHGQIKTIDEKKTLHDLHNELIMPLGALEKLRAMSGEDVNRGRQRYWEQVRKQLGDNDVEGVVVDKMPLNTVHLGLIYRLFPEAKIIFALRDPRDVMMSCFQHRFSMSVAMYQFLRLETAAAYYDQVMSLAETYFARMPLAHHLIRYEDVIDDMQTSIADLLAFLDLEWDARILNYRNSAQERWISTPSFEQVVKPLYTSSIGKWRNYERHLEPVLPILDPWIRKYGYQ